MASERRHPLSAACMLALALIGTWTAGMSMPATARTRPSPATNADRDLAWKAFLAAGKLDDAIRLAKQALQAEPNSVLWHRRLASAAEQNNEGALAARNYAWLASAGQQYALLPRAIAMALATQQDSDVIRLMKLRAMREGFNRDHWQQLVDAMLNAGQFQPLLDLLHRADRRDPRRFFLEQEVRVLGELGQPQRQATVLARIIARYGNRPDSNLHLATLQFVGDHLHAALHTLEQARSRAGQDDHAYWQTLASLAWMLQDIPAASHASMVLVRSGHATMSDYDRLFQAHLARQPAVAYAYALAGWQQLRSPVLFFDALTATDRMQAPVLARVAFATLRPADVHVLAPNPAFWTSWAYQAALQGHMRRAAALYGRALKAAPGDGNAEAGYIWLLIDSNDIDGLTALVDRLGREQPRSDAVRNALAAGQARVGRPTRALALMAPQRARHGGDAAWLVQYADLLAQVGRRDAAHAERLAAARALARGRGRPASQADVAARVLLRRQLTQELAGHIAPGDPARRATARLLAHARVGQVREQVLAWTTSLDHPQTSRLWLHLAYGRTPPPLWAQLGQALAEADDTRAMHLLEHDRKRLPHRDRVEAARRLGWRPLAATLAYRGLEGEPDDAVLAPAFRELALDGSDHVTGTLGWLRTSGVTQLHAEVATRTWLNHEFSLDTQARAMHQIRYDASQIGAVPSLARRGDVTLTQHLARGERGLSIGGGRNLAGYVHIGAFYDYPLSRKINLGVRADIGAAADDSMPLAIAGLADGVSASADDQWTTRDAVSARLDIASLRAQGGGHLGNRQQFDLEYRHQLWQAPPSVTLIASASGAHYQRSSALPDQLRPLLPPGGPASTAFFIPRDYAQACAGVGYNVDADQAWQPRLRLYGTARVCHNSVAGAGTAASGGLVTPVIGNDRLSLGFQYANNTGASATRTLGAMLSYRYDFTP